MTTPLDFSTVTLTHGSHDCDTGETCAREALHLAVTGEKKDRTPPGLSPLLAILPGLNDGPWRDDAHRTSVIAPYLAKLAKLTADPVRDRRLAFALADYAVRVCAGVVCEPIVDERTARAGAYAAAYASYAANAAGAAAAAASGRRRAVDAASSASYAASSASYASSAAAIETHARALLGILTEGIKA